MEGMDTASALNRLLDLLDVANDRAPADEELLRAWDDYAEEAAKENVRRLSDSPTSALSDDRRRREGFEKRLRARWRPALDLFEIAVELSRSEGSALNAELRPVAAADQDFEFDALVRLHAWACTVAEEVLTLLRSGFGTGAHARVRTLHEIAVFALAIRDGGANVAEKYLLHDAIESAKDAREYQALAKLANEQPLPDREVAELQRASDLLVERFGPDYRRTYGWAAELVGTRNPSFADIERHVGAEQWRLYYTWACHRVHATPKGVRLNRVSFRLQEAIAAGSSNLGLADPAQHALWALNVGSQSLFACRTSPDVMRCLRTYVAQRTLAGICELAVEGFVSIEQQIWNEEVSARAADPALPAPWKRS
jgi:hypothetical protein